MIGKSWDEMVAVERIEDLNRRIGEARAQAQARQALSENASRLMEVKRSEAGNENEVRAA